MTKGGHRARSGGRGREVVNGNERPDAVHKAGSGRRITLVEAGEVGGTWA